VLPMRAQAADGSRSLGCNFVWRSLCAGQWITTAVHILF
jgi:hypothetical protein